MNRENVMLIGRYLFVGSTIESSSNKINIQTFPNSFYWKLLSTMEINVLASHRKFYSYYFGGKGIYTIRYLKLLFQIPNISNSAISSPKLRLVKKTLKAFQNCSLLLNHLWLVGRIRDAPECIPPSCARLWSRSPMVPSRQPRWCGRRAGGGWHGASR
jgi:hypothetical protein